MARLFTFRGKKAEELQKLSTADFAAMLDSRQRRSIRRQGISYKGLLAKVEKARASGKTDKLIKTHAREAVILPAWIGMKFGVHSGKEFKELTISEEMVGHRLGEFAFSTKRVLHSAPGIRATRGSKFLSVK